MPELSRTRLAGARAILALAAVVALALSGCGGDSANEETTASASPAAAQASKDEGPSAQGTAADKGERPPSSPDSQGPHSGGQGPRSQSQDAGAELPPGEPEPQATPAEEAQATVADIALTSPALSTGSPPALPPPYTCDGEDSWPALRWQGVPKGTGELILFAANLQPVNGKLFFDWAVAGLDPSLSGIEAGRLPQGAIVGTNGFGNTGYSICPLRGQGETYVFALHAIPKALKPAKGFDPGELRREVLAQAGNAGILVFSYGR